MLMMMMCSFQGGGGNERVQRDRGDDYHLELKVELLTLISLVGWSRHWRWLKTTNTRFPLIPSWQVESPPSGAKLRLKTLSKGPTDRVGHLLEKRQQLCPDCDWYRSKLMQGKLIKIFKIIPDLEQEMVYCSGQGSCDTAELPAKVPSDQARLSTSCSCGLNLHYFVPLMFYMENQLEVLWGERGRNENSVIIHFSLEVLSTVTVLMTQSFRKLCKTALFIVQPSTFAHLSRTAWSK